ncbi:MAG: alpha/beta hydrolase [Pseudomonadota bacterium]
MAAVLCGLPSAVMAEECPVDAETLEIFAETGEVPVHFKVIGAEAMVSGTITNALPCKLARLIRDHPQVETLVFRHMPGSVAEADNLRAGRLLRAAGLNTRVKGDSDIASGAVTLFLAGVKREGAPGARLGVHTWYYTYGQAGSDYTPSAAEHRDYLDYYAMLGRSAAFYWFSLKAATPEEMHYLNSDELDHYGIFTE